MASYAIKPASKDETCLICDKLLIKVGVYCHLCKKGSHLHCSDSTVQTLAKLKLSRCQYTCGACLANMHPTISDTKKEIHTLLAEEVHKVLGNTTDKTTEFRWVSEGVYPTRNSEVQTVETGVDEPDPTTDTQTEQTNNLQPSPRVASAPPPLTPRTGDENPHSSHQTGVTNNRLGATQINKTICRDFIMKKCKYGRFGNEGGVCENNHPKLCFRFLRYGTLPQGCEKGQDCRFYHPKLCYQFNRRKECKRENCPFYHNTLKVNQRPQRNAKTNSTNPARRDYEIGGNNFRNRNTAARRDYKIEENNFRNRNAANRRDDPPRNAFDRYRNYNTNNSTFHGDVDVARGAYDYPPAPRVNYFPEHNFLEFQDKIQSQVSSLQHMLEILVGKTDRQPPGATLWKCAQPSY